MFNIDESPFVYGREDIEAALLRRELCEKDALLNARKKRRTGKCVAIECCVILLRDSILREVEKGGKNR